MKWWNLLPIIEELLQMPYILKLFKWYYLLAQIENMIYCSTVLSSKICLFILHYTPAIYGNTQEWLFTILYSNTCMFLFRCSVNLPKVRVHVFYKKFQAWLPSFFSSIVIQQRVSNSVWSSIYPLYHWFPLLAVLA